MPDVIALPPPAETASGGATASNAPEGVTINLPGFDIPNPVEDVVNIVKNSRETIAKGAWVSVGILLIMLGILGVLFAGIRNEVIDTAYNPAKERIKNTIRGTPKSAK